MKKILLSFIITICLMNIVGCSKTRTWEGLNNINLQEGTNDKLISSIKDVDEDIKDVSITYSISSSEMSQVDIANITLTTSSGEKLSTASENDITVLVGSKENYKEIHISYSDSGK